MPIPLKRTFWMICKKETGTFYLEEEPIPVLMQARMRNEVFHSKVDFLPALTLVFPVALCACLGLMHLQSSQLAGTLLICAALLCLAVEFLFAFPIKYELQECCLVIKSGLLLRYSVSYLDILEIQRAKVPPFAKLPAYSRRALRLTLPKDKYAGTFLLYSGPLGFSEVQGFTYISPKRIEEFECGLRERTRPEPGVAALNGDAGVSPCKKDASNREKAPQAASSGPAKFEVNPPSMRPISLLVFAALVVASFCISEFMFSLLPEGEKIATHWGRDGAVNGWDKTENFIFFFRIFLLGEICFSVGILSLCNLFPGIYNNACSVFLARKFKTFERLRNWVIKNFSLLDAINLMVAMCSIMLLAIEFMIVQANMSENKNLPHSHVLFFVVPACALMIAFFLLWEPRRRRA